MERLKVKGHFIEVNYEEEIDPYLNKLDRLQKRGNKIQACSPFREERHPSWAINLENGTWIDSGAAAETQRKGSFISLLAFFRGETLEETSDYLLEKYAHYLEDVSGLHLNINLNFGSAEENLFNVGPYKDFININSNYLLNRGINYKIQELFETGLKEKAVLIPWHDAKGEIINIKFRSIPGKEFWFCKGGQPIKNHVFGLFAVKKYKVKKIWLVESEIDSMYLWANNIPAVAFGGASISQEQKKLLLNSDIESIVIATDNDVVGHRFAETLKNELGGIFSCSRALFPEGVKDVNELTRDQLIKVSENLVDFIQFKI